MACHASPAAVAVRATLVVALLAAPALATAAGAQPSRGALRGGPRDDARLRPLLRADVFAWDATAVHAAAGATVALGTYLRLDAAAGGGPELGDGDARATARAELVARFVLDPFRRSGRGIYGGGGLAWWSRDPRLALTAVIGLEGGARNGWAPAVEIGLGRGARLGVALRRTGRLR